MHICRYIQYRTLLRYSVYPAAGLPSSQHLQIQSLDSHSTTPTAGTHTSSLTHTHTHTYTLTTGPPASGLGHSGYPIPGLWNLLPPWYLTCRHTHKRVSLVAGPDFSLTILWRGCSWDSMTCYAFFTACHRQVLQ